MRSLFIGAILGLLGCFSGPSQLSVAAMSIKPPSLMVAQKSPRTAYIVLDSGKVPAQAPVLVDGVDRGGKLTDVQTFVHRDLKQALSTYFADVQVVSPGQPMAGTPHVVVDVKLDRVEVVITSTAYLKSQTIRSGSAVLTWGIGLRPSEGKEYMFSFAGEAAGNPGQEPEFVFRSMFESAIGGFLKAYSDKNVHDQMLKL